MSQGAAAWRAHRSDLFEVGYTTVDERVALAERSYPGRPAAAKVQFLLEEIVSSLDG